jgi:hypothetical protein
MSDEKKLPSNSVRGHSVQLHGNGLKAGSLIEQSVSNLNQDQAKQLMAKAADEALRLEVKNREQNMDYVVGKKAAEDHIDTFSLLEKNGKLTRQKVISDIKTGAGNLRIESKSGATCFVASVAYGDPNHADVAFLRHYRDTVLNAYTLGRSFISWYWRWGPVLAKAIGWSGILRRLSRICISHFVQHLKKNH